MGETGVFSTSKELSEIFGETELKFILQEVMKTRKVSSTDVVSYTPIDKEKDGVKYVIKAEDVPIRELMGYATSSCRGCNGKGYSVRQVDKSKIPNPQDFVILSDRPIEGMTEAEKKLWLEVEKKKKLWRVMLPCYCTIKGISKKQSLISANALGNIVVRITYEVKQ